MVTIAEQRCIWVGSAGSMTAWGVVQSVRERWPSTRIVAADTNPRRLVAAAADADAFVRVPPADDPGFLEALADGVRSWGVDTWVPIHDVEIVTAARARDAGLLPDGLVTTAPSLDAAATCWDKLAAAHALERAGVPTPRTVAGTVGAWDGPCMVKPRNGVGSRGARLLASVAERDVSEASDAYVLQEPCRPPEVTIDAFRSARDGWFAAVCRERLEVRAGIATRARVHDDDELSALARATAVALGLTGTFCMQAMRSRDDDGWRVTDVNPRPGGATRMAVAVGMDFHAAMLADAWGEDPAPYLPGLAGERWVARGYVERVLEET